MILLGYMNRFALLLGVGVLTLLGAGCGQSGPVAVDGGVFKTQTLGADWTQPSVLNQGKTIGSIANVGTVTTAFDPQDPKIMYVGTTQNGLLMTLDGGESWQQARGLTSGRVTSIAVHPRNTCVVVAAVANQLMKTETCGRTWQQAYFDPRTAQVYSSVVIDPANPQVIYAGNTDGDILRSEDGGSAWRVIHRAESPISALTIDPRNTATLYAATAGSGLLKTIDRGTTWAPITLAADQFEGARRPLFAAVDETVANGVFHISRNGILRSDDGGGSWRQLALPTPPAQTNIRAFVQHPRIAGVLVYATDTSVVFTQDGGVTWTPRKLPSTRSASFLAFDKESTPALYLGTVPR
ncbi:MAG: hypothetical protein QG668_670 [Patescibacteria group bacterium]|nr:hypothetical protein [Patescibacteria group bacterium]